MACRGPFSFRDAVILGVCRIAVGPSGAPSLPVGSRRRSPIDIAVVGLVPTDVS